MSRLKDALLSLLGKCTPTGTHPAGDNVDEILECIARHYIGEPYIVNFTWGSDLSLTSDKNSAEVYKAFIEGKRVIGFTANGMIWELVSVKPDEVMFYSITDYTANSLQYMVVTLPTAAGGKCTQQPITLS